MRFFPTLIQVIFTSPFLCPLRLFNDLRRVYSENGSQPVMNPSAPFLILQTIGDYTERDSPVFHKNLIAIICKYKYNCN